MELTPTTLPAFRAALAANESIVTYADGSWDVRWRITQIIRNFLGWERSDDIATAKYFRKYVTYLEVQSPTRRSAAATLEVLNSTLAAVRARLLPYLTAERNAIQALKDAGSSKAERAKLRAASRASTTMLTIERRLIANSYRMTPQEALPAVREEDTEWVQRKLQRWRNAQTAGPQSPTSVTATDATRIAATCVYPQFVDLLRRSAWVRDDFFRFAFKSAPCAQSVDIAVQFPAVQKRLVEGFLDKRVRRLANNGLQFVADGNKDCTLLINGQHRSLRNLSQTVDFGDGVSKTVGDILRIFRAKRTDLMGDFEYTNAGVALCYPKSPRLDLTSPIWYRNLPLFEVLTREELQARYGVEGDYSSLLIASASRQYEVTNVQDNHSWFKVAIPQEDGRFVIAPIGKYADTYPRGLIGTFFYIFNTHKGVLSVLDENEFYSHRTHYNVPLKMNDEQFGRLMDKLRRDLILAREGNLVFMPQGDNCARWIEETLRYVFPDVQLPDVFTIPVLRATAPWPLREIIHSLQWVEANVSSTVAHTCRIAFCCLFGALRSRTVVENGRSVEKSLISDPEWFNGRLTLPAQLFNTGAQLQAAIAANT